MNLREPKTQKILLIVFVVAVTAYVYFLTSFLPFTYPVRKAKIEALDQQYTKLSTELEKARKVVNDLPRLEAEYDRLHEQWLSAQKLLPEEEEIPDLLRQVTTAGNKSGVTFALFEPQPPVTREYHVEHPVHIKVRGGYHQVGIFLSRLANMDRIVNVADLKLTENDKKATARNSKNKNAPVRKSSETVEAQFTLIAYTLLKGVTNEAVQPQHAQAK